MGWCVYIMRKELKKVLKIMLISIAILLITSPSNIIGKPSITDEETQRFHIQSSNPTFTYKTSNNTTDNAWKDLATTTQTTTQTTTANNQPTITQPNITNQTNQPPLNITWSILIQDVDSDLLNWIITCSNGQITQSYNDTSGKKQIHLQNLSYQTSYTMWVYASDGYEAVDNIYTFTLTNNNSQNNIYFQQVTPQNNSEDISLQLSSLSAIVHTNNTLFLWEITTNPEIGSISGINNGTSEITCNIQDLQEETTYSWNISIQDLNTDELLFTSFQFTTQKDEQPPPDENPDNGPKNSGTPPPPPQDTLYANAGGPYYGFIHETIYVSANKSLSTIQKTLQYRWDYNNDNTWDTPWNTYANETITYNQTGNYTIRLQINDGTNTKENTTTITIYKPNTPPEIQTVQYNNTNIAINDTWSMQIVGIDSDDDEIRYRIKWDQNSSETITGFYPTNTTIPLQHIWNQYGTYTVTITAEDTLGAISSTYTTDPITVYKDQTQQTKILQKYHTHETIELDAYLDGFIDQNTTATNITWDFGDGTTAEGKQTAHTYTKNGTYVITCTYQTAQGMKSSTATIFINKSTSGITLNIMQIISIMVLICISILLGTVFIIKKKK